MVKEGGEKALGLKDNKAKAQFIEFLRRFKQIYKKEFFADNLTSMLLRDLYVRQLHSSISHSLILKTLGSQKSSTLLLSQVKN